MSKRKSPVRSRQSHKSEHARSQAHAAVIASVRRAVESAIEPQALLRLLWGEDADHQIDIDQVVDQFMRTHHADGYRDLRLQKAALDELQESLFAALPEKMRADFNMLASGMYSRFVLAVDVGFEMGFAAARTLNREGSVQ